MPNPARIARSRVGIISILSLLALLATVISGRGPGGFGPPGDAGELEPGATLNAEVTRVVDGDTFEAELPGGETEDVRMIGVDTPETVDPDEPVGCYGQQASDYTKRTLDGRAVELELGAEPRDDYGRLLAYVVLDGESVNAQLLERGLAETLTMAPNDAMAARFAALERDAAAAGRGLWGAC
ncbi:hypothetical protein HJD18_12700 [Thermoleophilia bacterium SCSIO 60948]|nr:hypothetical protein HJD18_12700 [Thermoleophilia bacterium SCSIO 60948]